MPIFYKILTLVFLFSCSNKEREKNQEMYRNSENKEDKVEVSEEGISHGVIENKVLRLDKVYRFEKYKVPIYTGVLAEPEFVENPFAGDKEYTDFITAGCKENKINFAGHYTILQRNCGCECSHIFLIDRKDGKIFTEIKPNDGRYGYEFRPDSKLLIANSELFIDSEFEKYKDYWCKPEFYEWHKNNFTLLK